MACDAAVSLFCERRARPDASAHCRFCRAFLRCARLASHGSRQPALFAARSRQALQKLGLSSWLQKARVSSRFESCKRHDRGAYHKCSPLKGWFAARRRGLRSFLLGSNEIAGWIDFVTTPYLRRKCLKQSMDASTAPKRRPRGVLAIVRVDRASGCKTLAQEMGLV